MSTFFISDIHLDESHPEIARLFFDFLLSLQADALYILGDLFDVWMGDDTATPFHQSIISALKSVVQKGIPIYLMPGNRDFLLGSAFEKASGCQLLSDPTVINLYGQPTLLMHGDTLCTQDKRYLAFRRVVRNPYVQVVFLKLPLFIRQSIAQSLRQASQRHTAQTTAEIMDVTPALIPDIMRQYQVKQLIHGHTHRPAIHYISQPQGQIRRIVLGDWDCSGHMLEYVPSGEAKLIFF